MTYDGMASQIGAFSPVRVPFDDELAATDLSEGLARVLLPNAAREVVVICVGTDRSTGDAFGPLIGSRLQGMSSLSGLHIYGTLNEPVHAVNLASTLERVQSQHTKSPFILAIDACLGKFEHVGHIMLESGPLRPGAGVKKTLPEFGDYTLTGVVNVCGFMEYFVLQNTRLGIVMRMSEVVIESVRLSWQKVLIARNVLGLTHHSTPSHVNGLA